VITDNGAKPIRKHVLPVFVLAYVILRAAYQNVFFRLGVSYRLLGNRALLKAVCRDLINPSVSLAFTVYSVPVTDRQIDRLQFVDCLCVPIPQNP
jgi:hypothetical protein